MTWQIHSATEMADQWPAWDTLQRATTDVPFLESAFLRPLIDGFGSGRERMALHRGAAGVDAAVIVRPTGRGLWETFQPSQLPLGPWLSASSDGAIAPLIRSLLQALPGPAMSLGVTQLDPRLQPRPSDGPALRTLDYIQTSAVDVDSAAGFDAYWEARGKNLRQNTRKQRNKLQAEGVLPTLQCVTDPDGVAEALRHYGALESAGWKAGSGTAIHADNDQGRFYTRMLQNFCALGRGRIYLLRFGDKVVSMDLCIDNGPLVVILKTAYDESIRTVSPSTLMRHDEFKAWWDEGRFKRIEFYGKTMEWHTRWTEQERGLYHATAYRWGWLRGVHEQLQRRRGTQQLMGKGASVTAEELAAAG